MKKHKAAKNYDALSPTLSKQKSDNQDYLQDLANQYFKDRDSLKIKEIEILCMFHSDVRKLESNVIAKKLNLSSCEYKGNSIYGEALDLEEAHIISRKFRELGFLSTKTFLSPTAQTQLLIIEGLKNPYLVDSSRASEKLYKSLVSDLGVAPVFVYSFAGKVIIDVLDTVNIDLLVEYLQSKLNVNKSLIIISRDPTLSLGIKRITITDNISGHILKA